LIVETPVFTRRVLKLMSDEDYRELQQTLVGDPARGAIIRHSGGLRKIHWRALAAANDAVNDAVFARYTIGLDLTRYC
jgi:hypothetical protein